MTLEGIYVSRKSYKDMFLMAELYKRRVKLSALRKPKAHAYSANKKTEIDFSYGRSYGRTSVCIDERRSAFFHRYIILTYILLSSYLILSYLIYSSLLFSYLLFSIALHRALHTVTISVTQSVTYRYNKRYIPLQLALHF